jgi:uncharacterized protein (DUF2141 family)
MSAPARVAAGLALLAAAAAAPAAAQAPAPILGRYAEACRPGAQPAAALLVTIVGLKSREGAVRVEVYPATEEDWLADKNQLLAQGKPFRRAYGDIPASGPVMVCVEMPAPGRYAFTVLHDPDGQRGFNLRTDGVGFPGDPKLGMGRPPVSVATVTLRPGVNSFRVRLNYLRGLRFAPVDRPADDALAAR